MSAFMGGRGAYGNGADRFEPTRTGPIARATRGQAEADHADCSRQAVEDQRSPYPSATVSSGGTRRPLSVSREQSRDKFCFTMLSREDKRWQNLEGA